MVCVSHAVTGNVPLCKSAGLCSAKLCQRMFLNDRKDIIDIAKPFLKW
jgi:hypothetical protein